MERRAQREVVSEARGGVRRGVVLAALLLTAASGCVSSGEVVPDIGFTPVPVTQVIAIWSNQLMTGIDPTHNGEPMVGLAGRVFLSGPELKEYLLADGKLVVELYAQLPEQPQAPPAHLETWEIKKEILNSVCLRKDGFGQGYTLNLPWPSYRPDLTHLQFRMRYEPAKGGMAIYAQNVVTLNGGPGATPVYANRTETGDRRVITTGAPPAPPPAGVMPPPKPGAVQPALYQAPMPPPGLMPPPVSPPQPFPGAAQR